MNDAAIIEPGTRVMFARDVGRYPHFVVEQGMTGEVVKADNEMISVKLDEPVEGAEEWDNEVQWYDGMTEDTDFRDIFQNDVEVLRDTS